MNRLSQFIIASAKRDKKNVKAIKTKDKLLVPDAFGQVDLSNISISSGSSDSGGSNNDDSGNTPVAPTIPDSGFNIDPGNSLTDIGQLWTGTTDINQATDIVLAKNISEINGIRFDTNIVKTPVTNGKTGSQNTLPAVASNKATAQTGKYVCSVPIPVAILTKNLVVGKTINVALDGIGEGLATTKVSKSPVISIFVKNTNTLTIINHQGYALDKTTAGNNGAFYDGQFTTATSFTITKPVPQLPNGTVLFSGSLVANKQGAIIPLDKVNPDFSNLGSGLTVYLADQLPIEINASNANEIINPTVGITHMGIGPTVIKIPKTSLIKGTTLKTFRATNLYPFEFEEYLTKEYEVEINYVVNLTFSNDGKLTFIAPKTGYFVVLKSVDPGGNVDRLNVSLPIAKIESYQD